MTCGRGASEAHGNAITAGVDGPRKLKGKATRAIFAAGARRGKPSPGRFIKKSYVVPRIHAQ